MMRLVRRCALSGVMLGVAFGTLRAQAPMPAPEPTEAWMATVDSLVLAGDTVVALGMLAAITKEDDRNAAAWHRQGELALLLAHPPGTRIKWSARTIRYMDLADSSLATAGYLAPDSARYQLTRAMYFLASELGIVREGAARAYQSGLKAAQRSMDSTLVAELAIQLGIWYWRTYDLMAERRHKGLGMSLYQLFERKGNRRELEHLIQNYFPVIPNSGERDYIRATELFLLALHVDPSNTRAWAYSCMGLISLDAWEELESATRVRRAAVPSDGWAWMAAGLALHRTGKEHEATDAFRSGLDAFDDEERSRLTRLTRLLRPGDSVRVAGLPESERVRSERMFWMIADPLTLTAENEHQLEFLSRVTYAELMFTVEEFNERGADSPRGEVYIRYGPPTEALAHGPDPRGYYEMLWRYENGLMFYFRVFGQTRRVDEQAFAPQRSSFDKVPYWFGNLPLTRTLDTIPVAVTRFRAGGDSTDVVIAAAIPVERLVRDVDLARALLRIGFASFMGPVARQDTSSLGVRLTGAERARAELRTWLARFASPDLGFRVEAYQVESGKGARALGFVPSVPSEGFGMSDVLLADRLDPTVPVPERWLDLAITPNLGTLRQGEDLALAWETYDLGADSTRSSEYSVEISLLRTDGSRLGRAIARVIGGTLGRGEGRGRDDRVSVAFDRRVPARPVTLDYLTLDLGDLDPGRYRLTITVTDAVRNVSTESTRELVIVR
jgi:GWxTD domain-containing protein